MEFVAADGRIIKHDFSSWLESGDLGSDMDESAAKIAWAGAVLGLLVELDEVVDAEYRQWRADQGERIVAMNEKLSEFKVKQLIESSTEFVKHKRRIAEVRGKLRTMSIMVESLISRADTLRSKGANRRAEMRSIGMATMEEERPTRHVRADHEDENRERRIAERFDETST